MNSISFNSKSPLWVSDCFVKKKSQLTKVNADLDFTYIDRPFDKGRLKLLIHWAFKIVGEKKTIDLIEQFKTTGYFYATKAGISLSIDDLKIPPKKPQLILSTSLGLKQAQEDVEKGYLTSIEFVTQVLDRWNATSELLKEEVIENFRVKDILNPVYMMAFSGARGNVSQVRQLTGMRGLMADPSGQIINFPIQSNFREGLTLTEYMISCYGARKGVVDTALRTATSGYLTRRLVDVAHHVSVRMYDCKTTNGIVLSELKEGPKTILNLKDRLVGRVLAKSVYHLREPFNKVASRNEEISHQLATRLSQTGQSILVRSPMTCEDNRFVCQLCYGWSLALSRLVSIGESVGVIAAQSIGEPGTQLTMRTFHTGGVFSGDVADEIRAPFQGVIDFPEAIAGRCVRTTHGRIAFLTKQGSSFFLKQSRNDQNNYKISLEPYSLIFVKQNQRVALDQVLAEASVMYKLDQSVNSFQTIYSPLSGEMRLKRGKRTNTFPTFLSNVFTGDYTSGNDIVTEMRTDKEKVKDAKREDSETLVQKIQEEEYDNKMLKLLMKKKRNSGLYKDSQLSSSVNIDIGEFWILAAQRQILFNWLDEIVIKQGDWVGLQMPLYEYQLTTEFQLQKLAMGLNYGLGQLVNKTNQLENVYKVNCGFYLPLSILKLSKKKQIFPSGFYFKPKSDQLLQTSKTSNFFKQPVTNTLQILSNKNSFKFLKPLQSKTGGEIIKYYFFFNWSWIYKFNQLKQTSLFSLKNICSIPRFSLNEYSVKPLLKIKRLKIASLSRHKVKQTILKPHQNNFVYFKLLHPIYNFLTINLKQKQKIIAYYKTHLSLLNKKSFNWVTFFRLNSKKHKFYVYLIFHCLTSSKCSAFLCSEVFKKFSGFCWIKSLGLPGFNSFLLNRLQNFVYLFSYIATDLLDFLPGSNCFRSKKKIKNFQRLNFFKNNFLNDLILFYNWFSRFYKAFHRLTIAQKNRSSFYSPIQIKFFDQSFNFLIGQPFKTIKQQIFNRLLCYPFSSIVVSPIRQKHFNAVQNHRQMRLLHFQIKYLFLQTTKVVPLSQSFIGSKALTNKSMSHIKVSQTLNGLVNPIAFKTSISLNRVRKTMELSTIYQKHSLKMQLTDRILLLEQKNLFSPSRLKNALIKSLVTPIKKIKKTKAKTGLKNTKKQKKFLPIIKKSQIRAKKLKQKRTNLLVQQNLVVETLLAWQTTNQIKKLYQQPHYILVCTYMLFNLLFIILIDWVKLHQKLQVINQLIGLNFESLETKSIHNDKRGFVLDSLQKTNLFYFLKRKQTFQINYSNTFNWCNFNQKLVNRTDFVPKLTYNWLISQPKLIFNRSKFKHPLVKNFFLNTLTLTNTMTFEKKHGFLFSQKAFLRRPKNLLDFLKQTSLNMTYYKNFRIQGFLSSLQTNNFLLKGIFYKLLVKQTRLTTYFFSIEVLLEYKKFFFEHWNLDFKKLIPFQSLVQGMESIKYSNNTLIQLNRHRPDICFQKLAFWFKKMNQTINLLTPSQDKDNWFGHGNYLILLNYLSTITPSVSATLDPLILIRLQFNLFSRFQPWILNTSVLTSGLSELLTKEQKSKIRKYNFKNKKQNHFINAFFCNSKKENFQTTKTSQFYGWIYAINKPLLMSQNKLVLAGKRLVKQAIFDSYVTVNRYFSVSSKSTLYKGSYYDFWSACSFMSTYSLLKKQLELSIKKYDWLRADSLLTDQILGTKPPLIDYTSKFFKSYFEKNLIHYSLLLKARPQQIVRFYRSFFSFYSEVIFLKKVNQLSKISNKLVKIEVMNLYYRLMFLKQAKLPLVKNQIPFKESKIPCFSVKRILMVKSQQIYWNKISRYKPELLLEAICYKPLSKKSHILKTYKKPPKTFNQKRIKRPVSVKRSFKKDLNVIFRQQGVLLVIQKAHEVSPKNIGLKQKLEFQSEWDQLPTKIKQKSYKNENQWVGLHSPNNQILSTTPFKSNVPLQVRYTFYTDIWQKMAPALCREKAVPYMFIELQTTYFWLDKLAQVSYTEWGKYSFWIRLRYLNFSNSLLKKPRKLKLFKSEFDPFKRQPIWFSNITESYVKPVVFFKKNNAYMFNLAMELDSPGLIHTAFRKKSHLPFPHSFGSTRQFIKSVYRFKKISRSKFKIREKSKIFKVVNVKLNSNKRKFNFKLKLKKRIKQKLQLQIQQKLQLQYKLGKRIKQKWALKLKKKPRLRKRAIKNVPFMNSSPTRFLVTSTINYYSTLNQNFCFSEHMLLHQPNYLMSLKVKNYLTKWALKVLALKKTSQSQPSCSSLNQNQLVRNERHLKSTLVQKPFATREPVTFDSTLVEKNMFYSESTHFNLYNELSSEQGEFLFFSKGWQTMASGWQKTLGQESEGFVFQEKDVLFYKNYPLLNYQTKPVTELYYLTNRDLITYSIPLSFLSQKIEGQFTNLLAPIGSFISLGGSVAVVPNRSFSEPGQIILIMNQKIVLRRAKAFLLSAGGTCDIQSGRFINRDVPLLKLTYKETLNEDIIQGIPRIEKLFEARAVKPGVTLLQLVKYKFRQLCAKYRKNGNSSLTIIAARQSMEFIQHYTLDAIQTVYQSQGVTISDKHVEIIIKQMTSKVIINHPRQTGFLRGDLINFQWVETFNTFSKQVNKKINYEPLVLGITQTALRTEGFISAASFQETVNVLSQAAYFRKTDFLLGLKENVILGHLIQIGTGTKF